MFIGHIPAGYLVSKLLLHRLKEAAVSSKAFLTAGIFGAIAPDLDLTYSQLLYHNQHHHHSYWTHFPIVWPGLLLASLIWHRIERSNTYAMLAMVFSLNGFIHMLLDTIVGDIWWLAPFVDRPFSFSMWPRSTILGG